MFAAFEYLKNRFLLRASKCSRSHVNLFALVVCSYALPAAGAIDSPAASVLDGEYRLDYWTGLSGPLQKRWRHAGNLDLRASVNAEQAWGWTDTRFLLHLIANHGNHPNATHRTAQGIDNIEATYNSIRVFQAWGEKRFFDNRFSVLLGLLDLNSEFEVTESSATLIHPTFGTSAEFAQTGIGGPSVYPLSSLALRGAWMIVDHLTWRSALFDAIPGDPAHPYGTHIRIGHGEGNLWVNELSWTNNNSTYGLKKYALGVWRYSKRYDDLIDIDAQGHAIRRRNQGAYVLAERTLWQAHADDGRRINVFFRAGWASAAVNQMDRAIAMGFLWHGPLPSRPKDKLSLGIAAEHNGRQWRSARRAAMEPDPIAEISYELTYRAVINDHLSIQPDVQFLRNHGEPVTSKQALVVGLRLDFAF